MSAWVESASQNFVARHDERDEDDVGAVLELLEDTRERLGSLFGTLPPGEVTVVLHTSRAGARPRAAAAAGGAPADDARRPPLPRRLDGPQRAARARRRGCSPRAPRTSRARARCSC